MASRHDQFAVALTDTLTVTRLPIGTAADRWWLPFIFTGVTWLDAQGEFSFRERDFISLEGEQEPMRQVSGGGGGDDIGHFLVGISARTEWLRIRYHAQGVDVATEELTLQLSGQ